MVGRPSCRLRLDAAKASPARSSSSTKTSIAGPDYPPPNSLPVAREQRALTAVIANDKARHRILRQIAEESYHWGRFHTVWVINGSRGPAPDFCFALDNRHAATIAPCPFPATPEVVGLFNHLVGASEHRWWGDPIKPLPQCQTACNKTPVSQSAR